MEIKLNEACNKQHNDVLAKGFEPQPVAVKLMLIVSELGEACEADRKNKHADFIAFREAILRTDDTIGDIVLPPLDSSEKFKLAFEAHIKDTFEDEIADAFLRLMDLCGEYGIDIEKHIQMKAEYNKLRPNKHGKLY